MTIPTVEIIGLSEEVPVKVQPPVPELNVVGPRRSPRCRSSHRWRFHRCPAFHLSRSDPPLEPQPSPTKSRAPHETRAIELLFIVSLAAAAYGSVSPSSTSPSMETRSTSARSGATWTRAYPESGQ